MKKFLSIILFAVLALALSVTAFAADGVIDSGYCGGEGDGTNLEWTLTEDGTLTISGTGRMADYSSSSSQPWFNYRYDIKNLVMEDDITHIGDYAFGGMKAECCVFIPKTVKTIGNSAFWNSRFTGELFLPEGLESIGSYAFTTCRFTFIHIPSTLKNIEYVFANLYMLERYSVSPESPVFCDIDGVLFTKDKKELISFPGARTGDYVIPEGTEVIRQRAFLKSALSCLEIASTVKEIQGSAFEEIGFEITVNEKNEHFMVENDAVFSKDGKNLCAYFGGNRDMYVIPEGTEVIGEYVFNQYDIESVIVPESVKKIERGAFGIFSGSIIVYGNPEINRFFINGESVVTNIYFMNGEPIKSEFLVYITDEYFQVYYLKGTENLWTFDENGLWNGYEIEAVEAKDIILANGYCGEGDGTNLEWKIDVEGTLTISGTGKMADYDYGNLGDGTRGVNSPWYSYRNEITAIKMEEGITRISEYAFGSLIEVESEIIIPESVTSIGTYAFWHAAKESITIPASVTEIEGSPFAYCIYLKEINVAEDNPVFCSKDGKLYSKDMKTLYAWPNLRNEKIAYVPDGVETIATGAFECLVGMDMEVDIVLPDTVKTIKEYAFCVNGRIVVNSKIDLVDNWAFSPWNGTLSIYFMNGVPKNIAGTSFRDNGTIKLYYLEGTEGFTVDENGLWNGYEVKPFTIPADATVTVDSATVGKSGSKTVSVSITEDSGAASIQFAIRYDPKLLRVVSCEAGKMVENATINIEEKGIIYFVWESIDAITKAGTFLDIEFAAVEGAAPGKTAIEFDMNEDFIFGDEKLQELRVDAVGGTVTIVDVVYGDCTGDGRVNVLDANLVRRYAAKLMDLDENQRMAADVNGDGRINVLDANLIRKFAAKVIKVFPIEE